MKATRKAYTPKYYFVLTDTVNDRFPKVDTGLISKRELTDSLEFTHVFDDRDSVDMKVSYYNALYKGIATFEAFKF